MTEKRSSLLMGYAFEYATRSFDDAFEHEVWNETDEKRVVLLFDLWHFDLQRVEIERIEAMFQEVEEMQQARKSQNEM